MRLSWIAKTSETHRVGKAKWRLPHLDDAALLGMENVLIQQYIGACPLLPEIPSEASAQVVCMEGAARTSCFNVPVFCPFSILEECWIGCLRVS